MARYAYERLPAAAQARLGDGKSHRRRHPLRPPKPRRCGRYFTGPALRLPRVPEQRDRPREPASIRGLLIL